MAASGEIETGRTEEGAADNEELARFREQWRQELREKVRQPQQSVPAGAHFSSLDEAEELYWMGVSAEQEKDMGAAILYYRQAMQLVPDIDRRVSKPVQGPVQVDDDGDSGEEKEGACSEEEKEGVCSEAEKGVCGALSELSLQPFCSPHLIVKRTHISALPIEIMRYILYLMVVADLDFHSLEQVALVCKGFHALVREPVLWRLACRRIWGDQCSPSSYGGSWRRMFISRPHLHCNGVYISKSSYVRQGEHSLDTFYKPFHTVVYYRYLRFFADGAVAYMTSPEEPAIIVGRLKHKFSSQSVLLGHYSVSADEVEVVVVRPALAQSQSPARRRRSNRTDGSIDQHFHMELELQHNSHKLFSKLKWKEFSCHSVNRSSQQQQVTHFTLDYTYTPFYFSRVHSYSMVLPQ